MRKPQTERQVVGDYRLDVQDFGPIARASVDLRPLTVFVGPSNTGKSYLAILMYALHRCFGGPDNYFPRRYPINLFYPDYSYSIDDQTKKALLDWAREAGPRRVLPPLPNSLDQLIRKRLERLPGFDDILREEICRSFGITTPAATIRQPGSSKSSHVTVTIPQKSAEAIRYGIKLFQDKVDCSGQFPGSIALLNTAGPTSKDSELAYFLGRLNRATARRDEDSLAFSDMLEILGARSFTSLLSPVRRTTYYLPADRTGVMHSHQVVVSALIQKATTAGLRPSVNVPMLSGVLGDFLDHLISLPDRAERSQQPEQAGRLEDTILGGTIRMTRTETNYPEFFYRPEKWKSDLPLMRASSMVSELAPVVLYLRYLVQPGDVLIIEEPESHLHPAMQAAFARELARLVRSEVRIIITTHSEWFLEKIGNLMRLSELPKKKRAGIEDEDVALSPHEVGAWLFKPHKRPRGSVVEEVRPDPETGLFVTDHGEVTETLYNEGARIFNRLQEGDGE